MIRDNIGPTFAVNTIIIWDAMSTSTMCIYVCTYCEHIGMMHAIRPITHMHVILRNILGGALGIGRKL